VRAKLTIFGITFPVVMILDLITKRWALAALADGHRGELLGGLIPLTLAYNKGAAFGISIGDDSRWFFVPVTIIALVLLGVLLKQAAERDFLRMSAIAFVMTGAVGNLYDRVRWSRGVVDFIGPIELPLFGPFPIFNVADMSITCGAILLAISFWLEEKEERRVAASAESAEESVSAGDVESAEV